MFELWMIIMTASLVSSLIGVAISLLLANSKWYQRLMWKIYLKMIKSQEFKDAAKEMTDAMVDITKDITVDYLTEGLDERLKGISDEDVA